MKILYLAAEDDEHELPLFVSENHEEISSRRNILKQAEKAVCQDRERQYGSTEDNFKVIAELWSTYLECQVDAQDVASMMILLKLARVTTGQPHADNWVDGEERKQSAGTS